MSQPSQYDSLVFRLRELHRLSLTQHSNFTSLYIDYLDTGRRLLNMSFGVVGRIDGDYQTVLAVRPGEAGIDIGDRFNIKDTYCGQVVDRASSILINQVNKNEKFAHHPFFVKHPFQSYIAAPVWVNNRIFGTLYFTGSEARNPEFSTEDRELIELMALGLGRVIESDQQEQQRETTQKQIHDNFDLFESAFKYSAIGMALVAPNGRWLRVNNAVTTIVGYSSEELSKIDFQTITHPEDLHSDLTYLMEMLEGIRDTYQMEKRYIHKNGQTVWVLLSVSLVRNEDRRPRYFVSQIQDITEQKAVLAELKQKSKELEEANRKLQQLANKDPLTNIHNRRAFSDRFNLELQNSLKSRTPISLLLIDVDHFKQFNDKFGHQAGDAALKKVTDVLKETSRINDFIARYGGEEFAAILPYTDKQHCFAVAEDIRAKVAAINGLQRSLTVSIGATTAIPQPGQGSIFNAADLILQADEALYNAKAGGRNQTQMHG